MITAILLAAGQSKRLKNENKLIKLFKKKLLINYILSSLIKSKVNKIIIVLGFEQLKVKKKLLKSKKIKFVINKNYKKGISSSIKTGLRSLSKRNKGFLIVQADMPNITKTTINKIILLINKSPKEIFLPRFKNRVGNPIGFPILFLNFGKIISLSDLVIDKHILLIVVLVIFGISPRTIKNPLLFFGNFFKPVLIELDIPFL